jgi:hypothetical protein
MRKPFIIVTVIGLSIYFWPEISNAGWDLYSNIHSGLNFFPSQRLVVTIADPKVIVGNKPTKKVIPEVKRIIVVQEVTEPYVPPITDQVVFTPVPDEHKDIPTKVDPYESKAKRGLKAVGRFFKYKP